MDDERRDFSTQMQDLMEQKDITEKRLMSEMDQIKTKVIGFVKYCSWKMI